MRQGIKWNGGGFPALVQSKVVCGTENPVRSHYIFFPWGFLYRNGQLVTYIHMGHILRFGVTILLSLAV